MSVPYFSIGCIARNFPSAITAFMVYDHPVKKKKHKTHCSLGLELQQKNGLKIRWYYLIPIYTHEFMSILPWILPGKFWWTIGFAASRPDPRSSVCIESGTLAWPGSQRLLGALPIGHQQMWTTMVVISRSENQVQIGGFSWIFMDFPHLQFVYRRFFFGSIGTPNLGNHLIA